MKKLKIIENINVDNFKKEVEDFINTTLKGEGNHDLGKLVQYKTTTLNHGTILYSAFIHYLE
jgi:hypothetical protein